MSVEDIIQLAPIDKRFKHDAWVAYQSAVNEQDLAEKLQALAVPDEGIRKQLKSQLWKEWHTARPQQPPPTFFEKVGDLADKGLDAAAGYFKEQGERGILNTRLSEAKGLGKAAIKGALGIVESSPVSLIQKGMNYAMNKATGVEKNRFPQLSDIPAVKDYLQPKNKAEGFGMLQENMLEMGLGGSVGRKLLTNLASVPPKIASSPIVQKVVNRGRQLITQGYTADSVASMLSTYIHGGTPAEVGIAGGLPPLFSAAAKGVGAITTPIVKATLSKLGGGKGEFGLMWQKLFKSGVKGNELEI